MDLFYGQRLDGIAFIAAIIIDIIYNRYFIKDKTKKLSYPSKTIFLILRDYTSNESIFIRNHTS
ncbi:MAG: hypothetical protein R3A12_16715 [Ignavibacteria bacterium]